MASRNSEGVVRDSRETATSRRVLFAAGAGWVLGAAGLLLPASGNEAAAGKGADNGALGGRHGKDHRGRSKHRHGDNGGDDDPQVHHALDERQQNIWLSIANGSYMPAEVTFRDLAADGGRDDSVPQGSTVFFAGNYSDSSARSGVYANIYLPETEVVIELWVVNRDPDPTYETIRQGVAAGPGTQGILLNRKLGEGDLVSTDSMDLRRGYDIGHDNNNYQVFTAEVG